MQLSLDRRAQRLLRRLPRYTAYNIAEIAFTALLALQGARLVYAAVTPVNTMGNWRAEDRGETPVAALSILGTFDPFFRLSDANGPVIVTALDIKLFGTRADQASGRGSAIVGLMDGTQASFAVGDEILPGVTLKAVSFDSITVARGGSDELVYLDQSTPADNVGAGGTQTGPGLAGVPSGSAIRGAPPPSLRLMDETQAAPRLQGGTVTGIVLQPRGGGSAFRAAGLQPGDVLVSVGGQPVADAGAASQLQSRLVQGGEVAVEVERGGRIVTLRVKAGQ